MTRTVKEYPAIRWNPANGEYKVCNSAEEVPEGWLNKHPNDVDETPAPKPAAIVTSMTREEIVAELDKASIPYKKNAGTAALEKQLREAVVKFLTEAGVLPSDPPEGMTTKVLLGLIPKE